MAIIVQTHDKLCFFHLAHTLHILRRVVEQTMAELRMWEIKSPVPQPLPICRDGDW